MACFLYTQVQNILSKLPSKDHQENFPVYVRSMEFTLLTLKAIMLDAEEKQEYDNDLLNWLKELQTVLYQIEDTIDEMKWGDSQMEIFKQDGIKKKVRAPFMCSDPIAYKSQMARKMRKLCDDLDTVAVKVYEFCLIERNEKHLEYTRMEMTHSFQTATEISARLIKPNWQLYYPLLGVPIVYKRRRFKEMLEDFRNSDHKFFHIVGDAGMGKSTLVKFFLDDVDLGKNFSQRLWVCVGEDFDTQRLVKEILSLAIGEEGHDDLTEKQLLFKGKRSLKANRYLLVLQNLMTQNLDNLTMLMDILRIGFPGSKIIVTTQSEAVADAIGLPKVYWTRRLSTKNLVEGQSETAPYTIESSNIKNVEEHPEQNPTANQSQAVSDATKPSNVEGTIEQNSTTTQSQAVADATKPSNVEGTLEQDPTATQSQAVADAAKPSNVEGTLEQNPTAMQSQAVADATKPSNVEGALEQNPTATQSQEVADATKPSSANDIQRLPEKNPMTTQSQAVADDTTSLNINAIQGPSEQNQTTTEIQPLIDATEPSTLNIPPPIVQNRMSIPSETYVNTPELQTIYKIKGLPKKSSFSLFKIHAFRDAKYEQNPELNEIAEQIVQQCKGVPLVLKCLGGLLSTKTKIAEWKNVKDRICAQEEKDGGILQALRLCYSLLPSNLKRCFLHCSQLPNDRMFSSNNLIQLWMAHGLLNSPEEKNLSLENIGEKYFRELWERCFFQDIEEYGFGHWFEMHPLIRKLACIVEKEQAESSMAPKKIAEVKCIALQAREAVPPSGSLSHKCISRFKYLRLLYLGNSNLQEIPNAIGTLKYLKYLDLQGNKRIKRLPNSICDLQSLQTLILASCSELEELPSDIRNLISLRYLWVTTNRLHLQKNSIGTLTSLRFLAVGGCGDDDLRNLFEKVECLAGLETLMIYDCQTLKSLPNGIGFLKSLQNLVIWGCKKLTLTLEKVEFKLQRFTIRDLQKVEELPEWLKGSKETLRILDISNCPVVVDVRNLYETYEGVERFYICGVIRIPNQMSFGGRGTILDFVCSRYPRQSITFNKF